MGVRLRGRINLEEVAKIVADELDVCPRLVCEIVDLTFKTAREITGVEDND